MAITYFKENRGGGQAAGGGGGRGGHEGGGVGRGGIAAAAGARRTRGGGHPGQGQATGGGGGGINRRGRNLTMRQRQTGHPEPIGRSSLRSKASKGSSGATASGAVGGGTGGGEGQRMRKFKDCCRVTLEFTFTQVGVGALVVAYTIMGAFIFQYLETQETDLSVDLVNRYRHGTVRSLWNLTHYFNVLNKDRWTQEVDEQLYQFERDMVGFVHDDGYDQRTNEERWTFPAALMFALGMISMIGYGDIVPRSEPGKIATLAYATFGIPVYVLYFMSMGKVFANVLKWLYTKAYRWNVRRKWKQSVNFDSMASDAELDEAYLDELEQQVIVPSTTCLYAMTLYLVAGTVMFAEWEGWNYLDSLYFCFTSLAKIGFGDLVAGASMHLADDGGAVTELNSGTTASPLADSDSGSTDQVKLVTNFVYLLVGMGMVAMCYYLLREEVLVRVASARARLKEKLLRCRERMEDRKAISDKARKLSER